MLRNDVSGSNLFNRSWAQFRNEFGSPASHYWIGLDRLHQVTQSHNCKVRFDLLAHDGTWYFAQYSIFSVGDLASNYQLTIRGYSGNAGDGMLYENGKQFSTYDVDNDGYVGSCASLYNCGSWFGSGSFDPCGETHLMVGSQFFRFYNPVTSAGMYLNAVEVRLLC